MRHGERGEKSKREYTLSLYHFRKQLSYLLIWSAVAVQEKIAEGSYSLTSLHSGANDADMMLGVQNGRQTHQWQVKDAPASLIDSIAPRP